MDTTTTSVFGLDKGVTKTRLTRVHVYGDVKAVHACLKGIPVIVPPNRSNGWKRNGGARPSLRLGSFESRIFSSKQEVRAQA